MLIKQVSIFVSNQKGQVANITRIMMENDIDIRALVLFDTPEYSILRTIVSKPEEALAVLKKEGYVAKISKVVAVEPEDRTGSLNRLFTTLADAGFSIDYTYCFVMKQREMPLFVIKTEDTDHAAKVLLENHFNVVNKMEIYES